ncbi:MAG TPA: acyl carrier protein [Candidatus Limosilactobacillus merdigallinarum]|uniref:Acyl carrier protein n=1 Tax=Candidatus Limosilactobacillus merdigallinarum TaxID=2838652 RepID=A0A9D1VHF5_9LACO|nr:acyl carrier protein [Candidatus Limosilactobacillus merdigallinarum]
MEKKEIFDKVSAIVADHFDIDRAKITDDLNLKTDLDADSIDFVEFVLEVEDAFGATIEDDEAEKLNTIGEVVDYIYNRQSK